MASGWTTTLDSSSSVSTSAVRVAARAGQTGAVDSALTSTLLVKAVLLSPISVLIRKP